MSDPRQQVEVLPWRNRYAYDISGDRVPVIKCVIVSREDYVDQLLLAGASISGTAAYRIIVRDEWMQCKIEIGDYINLIGNLNEFKEFLVNNTSPNMIIIQPDELISGTEIGCSTSCVRLSLFRNRFTGFNQSLASVRGTVSHELFQRALQTNDFSTSYLRQISTEIIQNHLIDLYGVGEQDTTLVKYLLEMIPHLQEWYQTYICCSNEKSHLAISHQKLEIKIVQILAIEQSLWSPAFGLKGKLDGIVSLLIDESLPVPVALEIKSGKLKPSHQTNHQAQVLIYNLLTSEKYQCPIPIGLLTYLQSPTLIGVRPRLAEYRALLIRRNQLAHHLSRKTLSPMLQQQEICSRCYQIDVCCASHKIYEQGTTASSGVGEEFEQRTTHLTQVHMEYFARWDRLLDLEARDSFSLRREIWNLTGAQRQAVGRCLYNLLLKHQSQHRKYRRYTFEREALLDPKNSKELTRTDFSERDYVIVSRSDIALCTVALGSIVRLTSTQIEVETFEILEQPEDPLTARYRIDIDAFTTGFGRMRSSLANIISRDGDVATRRRVIDLSVPSFSPHRERNFPHLLPEELAREYETQLNQDQKLAARRTYAAKDYTLILGMPGTGKSSLIVFLIQCLVYLGRTVLITSYTNTAVDNLLLKLHQANQKSQHPVRFLRLGRTTDEIASPLHQYTLDKDKITQEYCSSAQLETALEKIPVLATTCLSSFSPILERRRRFDVLIGDEASQIPEPMLLNPLRFAETFVLVGDHYQLPPLVRDPQARQAGMATSLFSRLCQAHRTAVVELHYQYRMNREIVQLCNMLTYSSTLRCGTGAVSEQVLEGDRRLLPSCIPNKTHWLEHVLEPSRSVLFLDTDAIDRCRETRLAHGLTNPGEVELIKWLCYGMHEMGLGFEHIGIISPYRLQRKELRTQLLQEQMVGIHVDTIDRFQGRDKDCIIVSTARKGTKQIGELLKDWKRLNVAITRAKKKLLVVGSQSTLLYGAVTKQMMDYFQEHKSIYKLPGDALETYEKKERLNESGPLSKRAKFDEGFGEGSEDLEQFPAFHNIRQNSN